MNSVISNIETFPDELFIDLFEYLSPFDLYKTFYNLNVRFNSIINSLQNLHFILKEDWDNKEHLIPFFASQISTLIIKHDERVNFSFYPNICSLKLSMPTIDQCNAIQSSFLPNLEHLYVSNLFFSDNSEQLCGLIFSSSFSRLKTCQIDRMTINHNHSYVSLSLRQLTLSPCTWKSNLYPLIFQFCPRLTHLRLIRLRNLSFKLSSDHLLPHISIRYLEIHFHSIGNEGLNHIDYLLSMVPNLEHLTLLIEQNETNQEFSFDLFAYLLIQRVPYLMNLKAKIPLNTFLSKEFNAIQCLHPLFFNVQFQKYTNRSVNNYLIISSKQ